MKVCRSAFLKNVGSDLRNLFISNGRTQLNMGIETQGYFGPTPKYCSGLIYRQHIPSAPSTRRWCSGCSIEAKADSAASNSINRRPWKVMLGLAEALKLLSAY